MNLEIKDDGEIFEKSDVHVVKMFSMSYSKYIFLIDGFIYVILLWLSP